MVETRTTRFGLPQWSSGSDAPSRTDFNEAFANTESGAAYDSGETLTALPTTNLFGGRYVMVDSTAGGATTYRTLYRRDVSGGWDVVGGNRVPTTTHHRPDSTAPTGGDAWTVSHPSSTGTSARIGWDGAARVSSLQVPTSGVVVGQSSPPDPATLGQLHVTNHSGQRGIVAHPDALDAGPALVVQESGGSDVVTVDARGRAVFRASSAFGAASTTGSSAVTIAPSSAPASTLTTGLLLHGQDTQPMRPMLSILPNSDETQDPLAEVSRDAIQLGRLPVPGSTERGTIGLSGRSITARMDPNQSTWMQWRTASTDPTLQGDTARDTEVWALGGAGWRTPLPGVLSQEQAPAEPTLQLNRFTDFTGPFLKVTQATRAAGGIDETDTGRWDADGRIRAGAPWRGTGELRDSRQPVRHAARKVWAGPGVHYNQGVWIPHSGNYAYTWPVMSPRASTTTDLEIHTLVEIILFGTVVEEDAQAINIRTEITMNSGAFSWVDATENAPIAVGGGNSNRPGGALVAAHHRTSNVPAGSTFTLRTTVSVGPSLIDVRLRSLDVTAEECVLEEYTT